MTKLTTFVDRTQIPFGEGMASPGLRLHAPGRGPLVPAFLPTTGAMECPSPLNCVEAARYEQELPPAPSQL